MKNLNLITILSALSIGGCTVGPKFVSPTINAPSTFSGITELVKTDTLPNAKTNWWTLFGDATLDSLIEEADSANNDIKSAFANIEIARLTARDAKWALAPSFGMELSGGYSRSQPTSTRQNSLALKATINWELDIFGKLRLASNQEWANYKAEEFAYETLKLSLFSEVATNYFALLGYKKALDISVETLKSRQVAESLMDSMYKYGAISAIELEQARTLSATAAAAIPQYRRAVYQTEQAINQLLGRNAQTINCSEGALSAVVAPKEVVVEIPSRVLERRWDVAEAYMQLYGANSAIGIAVANRLPSFTLTGSGGLLTTASKSILSGDISAWSALGVIAAPLFNWGTNKRAVDKARLQFSQAQYNYQQTVVVALTEVEVALTNIATYTAQLEANKILVRASSKSLMMNKELYKNGLSNYLDLLDAERSSFSAVLEYSQLQSNLLSAYVDLFKVLAY